MHRDCRRIQRNYIVDCVGKRLERICGKPCNQIGVNILKTRRNGKIICLIKLLGGMITADSAQHIIIERLRIYAYSVRTAALDCAKLFGVDCIGPACLDGKFTHARHIKATVHRIHYCNELLGAHRRGSAASDVDGLQY